MMKWQDKYRKRLEKKTKRTQNTTTSSEGYTITLLNSDIIDIYNYQKYEDEHGITRNGWICSDTNFVADVNDMTEEKKEKEWGYDLSVDKTVYCVPNNNIAESSLIKYDNKFYSISKIKKCKNISLADSDAYYKIAITLYEKEVKVVERKD